MTTTKKNLSIRVIDAENLNAEIKSKMRNEVPEEYEVPDSVSETVKTISAELDIKKVAIVFAAIVVIGAVFASGLSFRTPIPKLDQELINTTDSLRGLEKVRIEYASGVTERVNKMGALEKEIVEINKKDLANESKIEDTKRKIEAIINAKSSAK